MASDIVVSRQGRRWAVVGIQRDADGRVTNRHELEGGFFTRYAAEVARNQWERELLAAEVAQAERKAGWDPNL